MKLFLALALAFGMASAQQHFMDVRMKQMQMPPPTPNGRQGRISPTLWYTQQQDNFDDSNTNTYEMKYWYNDEFCSIDNAADCPVFLFLNGEGAASSSWLTTGQW